MTPASVDPNAAPPVGADPGVSFQTFSGLKNTVSPESLTARQLTRARNIDLDDLGQIHRRRGRTLRIAGRCRSVYTTGVGQTFAAIDGVLLLVNRDFSTTALLEGIADEPLSWSEVGFMLYASSRFNSFKIDLMSMTVLPWGRVQDHSYQPSLEPGPTDFWFSPVVSPDDNPDSALGPVAGQLLGAPPLAQAIVWFNGRIYLAAGPVLWATELFLYDLVDKNAGYRYYESDITGMVAVEDGIFVGTRQALYYVTGRYGEETRTVKEVAGVVPGSMVNVPGELVDPEGRRFPDLPRPTSKGMACLTNDGWVVGLKGGDTYNLTRNEFIFPRAVYAPTLFRQEDGMNTLVASAQSSGGPADTGRVSDYLEAKLIRRGTPGQPGSRST